MRNNSRATWALHKTKLVQQKSSRFDTDKCVNTAKGQFAQESRSEVSSRR